MTLLQWVSRSGLTSTPSGAPTSNQAEGLSHHRRENGLGISAPPPQPGPLTPRADTAFAPRPTTTVAGSCAEHLPDPPADHVTRRGVTKATG